jgi:hypothetical protein
LRFSQPEGNWGAIIGKLHHLIAYFSVEYDGAGRVAAEHALGEASERQLPRTVRLWHVSAALATGEPVRLLG